jgi:hypothetical protein
MQLWFGGSLWDEQNVPSQYRHLNGMTSSLSQKSQRI